MGPPYELTKNWRVGVPMNADETRFQVTKSSGLTASERYLALG